MLAILFCACEREHPSPKAFLTYGHPAGVHIDSDKLDELNRKIHGGSFGDIHSLIILRNDQLVFENYYSNHQRSDLHPVGAATQSIVSVLTGIALAQDSTLGITDRIVDFFPEYSHLFENIPQKDQIEIRHLMSNTSGLWWDEWTHPFGSEENDAYVMSKSDDWIFAVLATPMIREPGFEFNYNSGNGILMAPVLEKLTGTELEQFAEERLFTPLNIQNWKWDRIPGGYVNTSWGLHLRPVDMAKIGYLLLKNGRWSEEIIFDESWSFGSTRSRRNVSSLFNYGYFWWRFTEYSNIVQSLRKNDVFFSWGDGGQFIFVIPHLDMVVVTTAGNHMNNDLMAMAMLRDYILSAVLDRYL